VVKNTEKPLKPWTTRPTSSAIQNGSVATSGCALGVPTLLYADSEQMNDVGGAGLGLSTGPDLRGRFVLSLCGGSDAFWCVTHFR
jgi:hypothetical protein